MEIGRCLQDDRSVPPKFPPSPDLTSTGGNQDPEVEVGKNRPAGRSVAEGRKPASPDSPLGVRKALPGIGSDGGHAQDVATHLDADPEETRICADRIAEIPAKAIDRTVFVPSELVTQIGKILEIQCAIRIGAGPGERQREIQTSADLPGFQGADPSALPIHGSIAGFQVEPFRLSSQQSIQAVQAQDPDRMPHRLG